MSRALFLAVALSASVAVASEARSGVDREVAHLLGHLEMSDCQFNRNGTWYNGADAAQHINTKYRFLVERDLVETTEQFIERAGTGSSLSGNAYMVRCGDADPVPSADWFLGELTRYRAASR